MVLVRNLLFYLLEGYEKQQVLFEQLSFRHQDAETIGCHVYRFYLKWCPWPILTQVIYLAECCLIDICMSSDYMDNSAYHQHIAAYFLAFKPSAMDLGLPGKPWSACFWIFLPSFPSGNPTSWRASCHSSCSKAARFAHVRKVEQEQETKYNLSSSHTKYRIVLFLILEGSFLFYQVAPG